MIYKPGDMSPLERGYSGQWRTGFFKSGWQAITPSVALQEHLPPEVRYRRCGDAPQRGNRHVNFGCSQICLVVIHAAVPVTVPFERGQFERQFEAASVATLAAGAMAPSAQIGAQCNQGCHQVMLDAHLDGAPKFPQGGVGGHGVCSRCGCDRAPIVVEGPGCSGKRMIGARIAGMAIARQRDLDLRVIDERRVGARWTLPLASSREMSLRLV